MNTSNQNISIKIFYCLLFGTAVVTVLHLVFQFLNLNVYSELNGKIFELSNRLDLDDEASIGTWLSQVMYLCIAITATIAGYLNKKRAVKSLWYLIATIGLIFSIDEVASLHEFGLQTAHLIFFKENSPTFISNAWWIFAPIIFGVAVWISYQAFKNLPRKTLFLFLAGGFMIILGAVIVDAFGSSVPKNTFTSQGIVVAIEETLELIGSATILYAVMSYLEKYFSGRIHKVLKFLKEN